MTSAGLGPPRGGERQLPGAPETALSAARFLKPTLPRTKTTLSGPRNSRTNMPLDKARPFSGPGAASPTPRVHGPNNARRVGCKTWKKETSVEGGRDEVKGKSLLSLLPSHCDHVLLAVPACRLEAQKPCHTRARGGHGEPVTQGQTVVGSQSFRLVVSAAVTTKRGAPLSECLREVKEWGDRSRVARNRAFLQVAGQGSGRFKSVPHRFSSSFSKRLCLDSPHRSLP